MTAHYFFDWSDLAFGSKKSVDALSATFIMAPREMSVARFTQIVKEYLPKGNIVLGLAKEPYILGFEDQPQFRTLSFSLVEKVITKVNASPSKYKIYTLSYFQRETKHLIEKLAFSRVLLVRGSWKFAFHTQPTYYALVNRTMPYEMISPFVDEAEARSFEHVITKELATCIPKTSTSKVYTESEMLALAGRVATLSFDNTFQTGAVLGRKVGKGGYRLLTYGFNAVVPYQTYAMHHGASREKHFSPPNDLNHYDTNHAEVELLLRASKEKISLEGTTLFVNLMPCPTCTRMLSQTDIAGVVCAFDHSGGYAADMFAASGRSVRVVRSTNSDTMSA